MAVKQLNYQQQKLPEADRMNFLDLYKKIQTLESLAPPSGPITQSEEAVEECGGDMPMPGHQAAPKQTDNVSMNVSMTGSGAGGIRDLINVLKNIDDAADSDDNIVVGNPEEEPSMSVIDDEYENSMDGGSDEELLGVSDVIPSGDDLHANMGDSRHRKMDMPIARPVSESLVRSLSDHYNEVKGRIEEGYGMRRYRSPGSGMGWSQDAEKRAFKRDELEHELRHEEDGNGWGIYINGKFWKAVKSERQANAIVNTLQSKGKEAKASYGSYF